MLTVSEAIRQRRSIRSFRSDPVPEEAIREMLESARLAPSGSNRQPWRFIVVTDAAEKAKLRQICFGQAFVEQAPVVFVCCADLTTYSKDARRTRYQEFIEHGVADTLSGRFADRSYWYALIANQDPNLKSFIGAATANTYIAIEHMVLAAAAMGLGTCWVGAVGEKGEVEAIFGLPDTTVVVALLPVGYPVSEPPPRPRVSLPEIMARPWPPRGE